MISNAEIETIFREIAAYLNMQSVPFKPQAYEKAAIVIAGLEEELASLYAQGGSKALEAIPGVGVSIAEKIEELIKTGRLGYYEKLKRDVPVDLQSFRGIEGLGPKKIHTLYQRIGIRNRAELERAARSGKIKTLEGFGEKSEANILQGIEFAKRSHGRFVLGFVLPQLRAIEARLRKLPGVTVVTIAGSVRRRKETIGDGDILVCAEHPGAVMDAFVSMQEVLRVYAKGRTKSAVKLRSGLDVDLRVVQKESYGAALAYFTGSKDHNVALRELAIQKGWKLNEYGLFKGNAKRPSRIAGRTEEEIYRALGMDYIEPEMREAMGEIERARSHTLPALVGYNDLRGDLHAHTTWTDGVASIEAMARAAANAGLEYVAITDHTKRLAVAGGLDEKKIKSQWREIDAVNTTLKKQGVRCTVLKGTECDILKNGSLDIAHAVLANMDVVGVSVHSSFTLSRKDQTERIIRAMENPHADIVFHPTGRQIQKRLPYEVDMDALVRAAKRTGTLLEIDAYPDRLDLKDEHIRKCVAAGVKLVIDSDAHRPTHFAYLEHGIAQARRGWAAKHDVVNTLPLQKMLQMFRK